MQLTTEISTWRTLIIDDEPDNLNLASDLLEFSGAATAKAKDALAGLEEIERFKPNLILLDLGMPQIDGWELHRQLRTNPALDQVPIIALTALAMPTDGEKVRAAGFDAYIVKPFRVHVLLSQIAECITEFTVKKVAAMPAEKPTDPALDNLVAKAKAIEKPAEKPPVEPVKSVEAPIAAKENK